MRRLKVLAILMTGFAGSANYANAQLMNLAAQYDTQGNTVLGYGALESDFLGSLALSIRR